MGPVLLPGGRRRPAGRRRAAPGRAAAAECRPAPDAADRERAAAAAAFRRSTAGGAARRRRTPTLIANAARTEGGSMKRAVIAIAAVLACTLAGLAAAQAPAAQAPAAQPFGVPGRGNLLLNVPKDWRVIDQGLADPASVLVRMRPATGDAFYLQITSVWLTPDKLAGVTDELIRSRVQESAKRMLPKAVETEAPLAELRGKDAIGWYFALSDRTSPNAGNEYKYVVQGTVRTGELITVFTLLHRDPTIPEKEQVLRMLADASFARGAAAASAPRSDALQVASLETSYELSVPVSRLVMTIPKGKLTRGPAGAGGNHPRYFYFLDGTLNVSGWFEPAEKFRGITSFWEGETRGWQSRGLPEPRNVAFGKVGEWDAVFYDMELPGGTSTASNTHIRAHWVQSGTWIDVHLSLTSPRPAAEARAELQSFLETIQVKEKK
jgi:hypothetical protein